MCVRKDKSYGFSFAFVYCSALEINLLSVTATNDSIQSPARTIASQLPTSKKHNWDWQKNVYSWNYGFHIWHHSVWCRCSINRIFITKYFREILQREWNRFQAPTNPSFLYIRPLNRRTNQSAKASFNGKGQSNWLTYILRVNIAHTHTHLARVVSHFGFNSWSVVTASTSERTKRILALKIYKILFYYCFDIENFTKPTQRQIHVNVKRCWKTLQT